MICCVHCRFTPCLFSILHFIFCYFCRFLNSDRYIHIFYFFSLILVTFSLFVAIMVVLTSVLIRLYLTDMKNTRQIKASPMNHKSPSCPIPGHWRCCMSHPPQAITNAILSHLIIDCNLARSVVENKSFCYSRSVLDSTAQCVAEH